MRQRHSTRHANGIYQQKGDTFAQSLHVCPFGVHGHSPLRDANEAKVSRPNASAAQRRLKDYILFIIHPAATFVNSIAKMKIFLTFRQAKKHNARRRCAF
jgi:hypothetical protein